MTKRKRTATIIGMICALMAIIFVLIGYYILDIYFPWLHKGQEIYLQNGKSVTILYDNYDDMAHPFIKIEERGKILVKNEPINCCYSMEDYTVIPSSISYNTIGLTTHGYNYGDILALYDFNSKEFWSSSKNDQELGNRLLGRLLKSRNIEYVLAH